MPCVGMNLLDYALTHANAARHAASACVCVCVICHYEAMPLPHRASSTSLHVGTVSPSFCLVVVPQADGGSSTSKNGNSTQLPLAPISSTTTAAITITLMATIIEVTSHAPVDSPVLHLAFDTLFALHDTQAWVGLDCASLSFETRARLLARLPL